jgi:putative membrane protein
VPDRVFNGLLITAFAVVLAISGLGAHQPDVWLLENTILLVALPVLALGWWRVGLSRTTLVLIFVFLCLHEIGTRYTYSEVPYDSWFQRLTGRSLNAMLGWERNHYDRLVHFFYGLLITSPVRHTLMVAAGLRGVWSYLLPLAVMVSTSTAYELIEWAAALLFGGDLGMAYLGTQGDVWDAHKDTALASLGAVLALAFTWVAGSITLPRSAAPRRLP